MVILSDDEKSRHNRPPGINYTNQAGRKQRPGLEAHPTMDQSFMGLIMLE
jgi:hypothetical protein